jgi:hypothetical protein
VELGEIGYGNIDLIHMIQDRDQWRVLVNITNSVALVREGTIPTERPLLVGEVNANFCG